MAERTAILNVVGLTTRIIGKDTPHLAALAESGGHIRVKPVLPAVTCTAQSTYLTGLPPAGHGCVANGWFDRTLAEHHFWKQSNHVVQGRKLWEVLRDRFPGYTCAKLFWWYNMYSTADWSITPRPLYPADGRKVFDIYTHPMEMREEIKKDLEKALKESLKIQGSARRPSFVRMDRSVGALGGRAASSRSRFSLPSAPRLQSST
ncbi:MAG TPA: alkaline phosphatase family protein [Opitutaceae bacterium]|nr:alkaline phosphatase family protein [Opitutaceae bacterium]